MITQNPETIATLASSLRKYTNIEPVESIVIRIAERIDRFKGNRIHFDKFWDIHTVVYNHYTDFGYDFAYLVTVEIFKSVNREEEVDTLEG